MKKSAIVAGILTLDLTPVITGPPRKSLAEAFTPGRTTLTEGMSISCGGAVANTGIAMHLFGTEVHLVGRAGIDAFGSILMREMERWGGGLSHDLVVDPATRTSHSVILAVPGIDRIFLHDSAANQSFGADDVDFGAFPDAGLFHFGYPSHMTRISANGGEELAVLYRRAKERGLLTSLDLAPVDPDSPAGKEDWRAILSRVIPYVDFLVPSIEEVCQMTDPARHASWRARALEAGSELTDVLSLEEDIRPVAEELLQMGAKVVLLKCGAPGLYLKTAGALPAYFPDPEAWSGIDRFEAGFVPDRVRSGTGAGDVAIAAFLSAVLEGRTPENCLSLAAGAGAMCVTEYDALSGLLPFAEMEERIRNGWKKSRKM